MLFSFRLTQILLDRGNFPLSGYGFGSFAMIRASMGAFDEGLRYGRHSLRMFEESGDATKKEGIRMRFIYWSYIAHWRLPLREGLKVLSNSLRQLRHAGALDYYHQDARALYRAQFACGEPLSKMLHDSENYSESLLDYKQLLVWNFHAPLQQAVLNFMGRATDPRILIGKHINVNEKTVEWKTTGNKMALYQSQFFGMIVAYYFQDYDLAESNLKQIHQDLYEDGPDILVPLRLFYAGLTYLARFRVSGKCVYKRGCQQVLKQFQKWVKDGAVNCFHLDLILQAEMLATTSASKDVVVSSFDKAISSAGDICWKHHQALANELAGIYLYCKSDLSWARLYLENAVELYKEWGATAKVDDIKNRFRDTLLC